MENSLITTICRNENKIFNELTRLAGKHECNINYSHLYALGLDTAIALQITGNWSSIAKIEAALPPLAKRLETELVFKRSHQEEVERFFLPYKIEIVAVDQPGIMHEITEFVSSLEVHIQQLEAVSLSHQQTPIMRVQMQIDIPAENNIADIREQFLVFCDELNLDGVLEPEK